MESDEPPLPSPTLPHSAPPLQVAKTQPTQLSEQSHPTVSFVSDPHKVRITMMKSGLLQGSCDEDSIMSQTSSISGYRESYPTMQLRDTLESSPKIFPPLASPDLHDLPSTSSATINNFAQYDNSSPDCSFNDNGEKTALLRQDNISSSQHSLLIGFDTQDETTLI